MEFFDSIEKRPVKSWDFNLEHKERHEQEAKDVAKEPTNAHQPWRVYWPPVCHRTRGLWHRSEFPEVLSWRFDPDKPFDRPWRTWTKFTDRSEEQAAISSCLSQETGKRPTSFDSAQALTGTAPLLSNSPVDDLVSMLNLRSITTHEFGFLKSLDLYRTEKAYLSRLPGGTDLARTNIFTENHSVRVFDVSSHEDLFTLAQSGFKFAKCEVSMEQWTDSSVCLDYIPRLEKWLVQHLKCSRVFSYAYSFREISTTGRENKNTKAPFLRAHCDATATSCLRRLKLHLPDESRMLAKARIRFLNVWRPISTPVQDCPLALCDFRTVRPKEDLVPADIIFPHYVDEAYEVLHKSYHRWFYKKGMDKDDVLLFKLGDTSPDEAPLCPHGAFMDPSVPKGTPSRASIEVRFIVID